MDQVTADTIQLLLEGDNIITAIHRTFDGPTIQGGPAISNLPVKGRLPYGQLYNEMYPPEQQTCGSGPLLRMAGVLVHLVVKYLVVIAPFTALVKSQIYLCTLPE